jgi:hypothetical protein
MWARIDGGAVRELTDQDPAGCWHESIVWVPCDDLVKVGDTYDGTDFGPPPAPTAEEVQRAADAAKLAADRTAAFAYAKLVALSDMTPAQIQTWIGANVTNLAQAQDAITTLAIGLSVLIRRERKGL